MPSLKGLKALPVLDSNGNLTIMVEAVSGPHKASAIVPSGSSTGIHEAKTISVAKAVTRVKRLSTKLKGTPLDKIDSLIVREAGNVSTGISTAVHRLIALHKGVELFQLFGGKTLPVPFLNVINGGVHAGNNLAFQEFMVVPLGKSFSNSLMIGVKVYHALKDYLKNKYGPQSINVGLEGGFAPRFNSVEKPLKVLTDVISRLGYSKKVGLAIDAAASQFYSKGGYVVNGKKFSTQKLIDYYERLTNEYNIVSIEDPFHEDDFKSFTQLTRLLKGKARVVGDDLLVSNPSRVRRAVNEASCNCLLLKVNQVGTVSRALESVRIATKNDWSVMVSHRSGDSCDSFIADLAVGINAGMIKTGAPARGERVSKYNRLLEIERKLGLKAVYPKKVL